MKKPTIQTIIIIICLLIVGLYAAGEVNYFSSKVASERNITSPVVIIHSIGVHEKINNETLSHGVLHETSSYNPDKGDIMLFGHRTLQGSPFFRLNELKKGDKVILEWPHVGEITYKVSKTTIVPENTNLEAEKNGTSLYLITCDPIGSTANRLIVKCEQKNISSLDYSKLKENPQKDNALLIAMGFLILGSLLTYFYPKENNAYILATVIIISLFLFYFCINPIPSEIIYDKIMFLNGGI